MPLVGIAKAHAELELGQALGLDRQPASPVGDRTVAVSDSCSAPASGRPVMLANSLPVSLPVIARRTFPAMRSTVAATSRFAVAVSVRRKARCRSASLPCMAVPALPSSAKVAACPSTGWPSSRLSPGAAHRHRGQASRQIRPRQLRQAERLLRGRFRRWCRCRQPRQRHAARADIGDGEPCLQQCRRRQLDPGILDLEPGALVVAQPQGRQPKVERQRQAQAVHLGLLPGTAQLPGHQPGQLRLAHVLSGRRRTRRRRPAPAPPVGCPPRWRAYAAWRWRRIWPRLDQRMGSPCLCPRRTKTLKWAFTRLSQTEIELNGSSTPCRGLSGKPRSTRTGPIGV